MNTKSIWWHNPKLRTDGERDADRKATWLELFFDLVFVAAIATLAHELSHEMQAHPSPKVLVTYIFLFIPIWWVWIGNTFYNERFETNDIGHRIVTLIQMAGVAGLAYFAHEGLDAEGTKGFALAYAFCRIVIIALWWRGAYYNPSAIPSVKIITLGFGISVAFFIASVFVDPPLRFVLWAIGLSLDLIIPIFSLNEQEKLPSYNSDHMNERFGLFAIIVLGESVAGAVYGTAEAHNLDLNTSVAGLLGLGLAFSLWFIYFDQVMNTVMGKNRLKQSAWYYLHPPLMMSLTAIGAGLLAIIGTPGVILSPAICWLICGASASSFLLFGALEHLSEGWADGMGKPSEFLWVRLLCAIAAVIVGYFGHHLNAISVLSLLFVLALIQVIMGVYLWVQAVKKQGEDYQHGWQVE